MHIIKVSYEELCSKSNGMTCLKSFICSCILYNSHSLFLCFVICDSFTVVSMDGKADWKIVIQNVINLFFSLFRMYILNISKQCLVNTHKKNDRIAITQTPINSWSDWKEFCFTMTLNLIDMCLGGILCCRYRKVSKKHM